MGTRGELAKILADYGARSPLMDTEDEIRKQVLKLVRLGVSQKVLAREMGVTESWLSRWLAHRDGKMRQLRTFAMDRLADYLILLLDAIQTDVRTPVTADAIALMAVVKQIDAAHRQMVTATLQGIVNHQKQDAIALAQERQLEKPSTPPHRETALGPRPSSQKKAAGAARRRRPKVKAAS